MNYVLRIIIIIITIINIFITIIIGGPNNLLDFINNLFVETRECVGIMWATIGLYNY